MASLPWIKICGVTSLEDARTALDLGADAVGLNLVPSSKRYVQKERALEIAAAIDRPEATIFVVADLSLQDLLNLKNEIGEAWLQLHGSEPHGVVERLLPRAYKAVGIGGVGDVARARSFPGERLLVDALHTSELGGTGTRFDWRHVQVLAKERPVILAGGLNPENVSEAVRVASPWGLDVATGVEVAGEPRRKDPDRVARFIGQARSAWADGLEHSESGSPKS